MYLFIIALNIIPDLGIEIYSVILPDNLKTLIKINLMDIGIFPYIVG